MFTPETYKTTKAESIGKGYTWARRLAAAATVASVFVYLFVNPSIGFWLAFIGFVAESVLISRERYLCVIRDIDKLSEARLKLIDHGEHEYVLECIASDQIWRGEPVSEEVKSKLNHIRNEREQIKTRVEGFLSKLVSEYGVKTNDEGGN
jgi:hypothetical protein